MSNFEMPPMNWSLIPDPVSTVLPAGQWALEWEEDGKAFRQEAVAFRKALLGTETVVLCADLQWRSGRLRSK